MKTLMLLRHAKSSWDDEDISDHDRPLNKRGKKTAPRMGQLLAERGLVPDLVLSSAATRTAETAKAVVKAAKGKCDVKLVEELYLATAGELLEQARTLPDDSVERLMLVGHNPGMEDLVEMLAGRKERFPTAALAVFELELESWRRLDPAIPAKLVSLYRPKEL